MPSVQIGYEDYRYLTFGFGNEQNGRWGLEHWDGGLNFWRPWPLPNSGNYFLFLSDNGNVGVGMKPNSIPFIKLQVHGLTRAWAYVTGSDESLKENVKDYKGALNLVAKLKPVSYNFKTDVPYYDKPVLSESESEVKRNTVENDINTLPEYFKQITRIGFIAQDLEEVIPEVVFTDSSGLKSVNYDDLIPVAIQAIKEQQEQIEQLKAELENVKALNRFVTTPNDLGILATLYQNDPNPFNQRTTIKYSIESDFEEAFIDVYDFWGNSVAKHSIVEKGKNSFVLEANSLKAGTYHYSLVVNGVVVDTRIMFIQK